MAVLRPIELPVAPALEVRAPVELPESTETAAESLYQQGRYAEAEGALLAASELPAFGAPGFSLLTRALANQGKLVDALTWCDRWVGA